LARITPCQSLEFGAGCFDEAKSGFAEKGLDLADLVCRSAALEPQVAAYV